MVISKVIDNKLCLSKIFDSDLSRLTYFPDTSLHFSSGGVRGVALLHSPLLGTKGRSKHGHDACYRLGPNALWAGRDST